MRGAATSSNRSRLLNIWRALGTEQQAPPASQSTSYLLRLLSAEGLALADHPASNVWSSEQAQFHSAPHLHARHNTRDDFWIPPDPSLSELVFKASEPGEDSKRQDHLATVKRRLPDAALEEVVAVVEAAAASGLGDKELVDAACKELIGDGGELSPAQLMAASMAFAQVGHFSTDWKNIVSKQAQAKLGEFRPSLLAALVKAFGIAGYVDGTFYDMVSKYVEQNIRKLGPQHLAEIAFGANAGGCVTASMQNSIEMVAPDYVKQADMRGLAFFMEAYTLVRCFDADISEQAAIRCSNEMKGTDSGSLVRLMKALSKLGQDDAELFGRIAQELHERGVHLLSNQDLSSAVSIFSGLVIYNKDLINSIVQHILEHPENFSQELHPIQECCNNLGHYSSELSEAVEKYGDSSTAGFQTA
ncbi:hypothetical protein WJX74_004794 [Apatococcus lobatus]|uniref:Uncharacterized protein n=2 Tax=Apatococcus TaxID=904362 RepID=A0AAW1SPF3_9CHLO